MGLAAAITCYSMTGVEAKKAVVRDVLTISCGIGRAIREGRAKGEREGKGPAHPPCHPVGARRKRIGGRGNSVLQWPGPPRDMALLNAAAAIYVSGRARTMDEGLTQAAKAIDSGQKFKKYYPRDESADEGSGEGGEASGPRGE